MLSLEELEALIGLVSEKKLSTVDDDDFNYWEEIETHLEEEYERASDRTVF